MAYSNFNIGEVKYVDKLQHNDDENWDMQYLWWFEWKLSKRNHSEHIPDEQDNEQKDAKTSCKQIS